MRINLKTKIWITVFAIVLMFSFFSLYYFPAEQEKIMKNSFNNEAQNLANTISLGVKIALYREDFESMKLAMSYIKDDPRLIFVHLNAIIDTNWNSDHTQYDLDSMTATFPEGQFGDSFFRSHAVGDTIMKESPFATRTISGVVLLCFSTNSIIAGKKQIRTTSLLVSAVVLLIGILIGFWLARNISVPVLALREAAAKVGEGDLTQRVLSRSKDEIGDLARAFNSMVGDLARAREDLREANLNLAQTNKALHATVADLKSAQEQLIQAEKMASLGQLTAGIAHELNNPINFITANTQPLKDDMADILKTLNKYEKLIADTGMKDLTGETKRYKEEASMDLTVAEVNNLLKGIEDGAKRTSEIVKGLRNFSRMDQNVLRRANLNESLDSTLTLLYNSYKNRIEIVKEFGELPEVECFPGQMNQVFMNILSNAIQAIPGEGKITIKTSLEPNMARISVKDTGTGMTDDVKKKIFDPFFTTKDVGKGTGLGLSISFGIIQKHNGKIDVFSKPGEGTEFVIKIPVIQNQ